MTSSDPLKILPASSFVAHEVRRLKNASVVYVNLDLFHAHGWFIDKSVLDDEVRAKVLEQFAYAIPQADHPLDAFSDETKTWYAERYGGHGTGQNGGGSRCSLTEGFQIKGTGPNPLVGVCKNYWYTNGNLILEEALREAINAEIAHAATPYGANRVFAVIATGVSVFYKHRIAEDVNFEERRPTAGGLLVRETGLRPAHYQRSIQFRPQPQYLSSLAHDTERTRCAMASFVAALPEPQERKFAHPLLDGLYEFVKRTYVQKAVALSRRVMHAGYTPSNVMMDGRWIDFGTLACLSDYSNAIMSERGAGLWEEINGLDYLVREIAFFAQKYLPEIDRPGQMPTGSDLSIFGAKCYRLALEESFLILLGFDIDVVSNLSDAEWRPCIRTIIDMAYSEHPEAYNAFIEMNICPNGPDIGKWLLKFVEPPSDLEDERLSNDLREEFGSKFESAPKLIRLLIKKLECIYLDKGVSKVYLRALSAARRDIYFCNTSRLYRPNLVPELMKIVDGSQNNYSSAPGVQREIDNFIHEIHWRWLPQPLMAVRLAYDGAFRLYWNARRDSWEVGSSLATWSAFFGYTIGKIEWLEIAFLTSPSQAAQSEFRQGEAVLAFSRTVQRISAKLGAQQFELFENVDRWKCLLNTALSKYLENV